MHIDPSVIKHNPGWTQRRKQRHVKWLRRVVDRSNPGEEKAILDEIAKIEASLPPKPPEQPQTREERLRRLVGQVSAERASAEKQLSDLKRGGGGCGGCRAKTIKVIDAKAKFFAEIEDELKKNLPKP